MKLLYCDESNMEERAGDFLVYGGVIIPSENAKALSEDIRFIRQRARIAATEKVKFLPAAPPCDHASYIQVKQAIIEAAITRGAKLTAYLVLHDLAKSPDQARLFGINTVCTHFNSILKMTGGPGIALIDRINNPGSEVDDHLREKFSVGVRDMPYSKQMRLENIIGFHYSTIGQAHFTSLCDILIGSLRFAINAHTRSDTGRRGSALRLLKLISPLFFREKGTDQVSELGLALRSKNVGAPAFFEKYHSLQSFLREGQVDMAQKVTNFDRWKAI